MRWLITGGCGFIGRNLIRDLRRDSDRHGIRVLDNLSTGTREDLRGATSFVETPAAVAGKIPATGVELVVGDIGDAVAARGAAAGADVIVHLAANAGVQNSIADPMAGAQQMGSVSENDRKVSPASPQLRRPF